MTRENWQFLIGTMLLSWLTYRTYDRNPYSRHIQDAWKKIEYNYLEPLDAAQQSELAEQAIKDLVGNLDKFSNYIPPERATEFLSDLKGNFGGIGVEIWSDPDRTRLLIRQPIINSPAAKAGLQPGDEIIAVDTHEVAKLGAVDAQKKIRGEAGSIVNLKILRGDQTLVIPVQRAQINEPSVVGYVRQANGQWNYQLTEHPKIGYVHVTSFNDDTVEDFKDVLIDLKQQSIHGLIIDLRDNPGGYLNRGIEFCDLFLKSGIIVSRRGRSTETQQSYYAQSNNEILDCPLVVLINENSASASELVAAALQDHQRARLVGVRTYGKGSIQDVIPLRYPHDEKLSDPILKLTVGHYFSPLGKKIHRFQKDEENDEWGVKPLPADTIPLTKEQDEAQLLWQSARQFDGWKFVIENEAKPTEKSTEKTDENNKDETTIEKTESKTKLPKVIRFVHEPVQKLTDIPCPDLQLQRAVDVLAK